MRMNGKFFHFFPRWVGILIVAFGLLLLGSWYEHWQGILQWLPNTAPMQFNTALCFVLSGAALFFLTTSQIRFVAWPGGLVVLLAALTLIEYLSGWNLRIDQLLYKPYFEVATAYPGRMSPLAAVCFTFTGISLMLAGTHRSWRHRLPPPRSFLWP